MRNNEKTPGEKTPKRNLTFNAFAKNASLVSNISVEDKQATSVVIGALKMKRN